VTTSAHANINSTNMNIIGKTCIFLKQKKQTVKKEAYFSLNPTNTKATKELGTM
jgi:hypothetical protein